MRYLWHVWLVHVRHAIRYLGQRCLFCLLFVGNCTTFHFGVLIIALFSAVLSSPISASRCSTTRSRPFIYGSNLQHFCKLFVVAHHAWLEWYCVRRYVLEIFYGAHGNEICRAYEETWSVDEGNAIVVGVNVSVALISKRSSLTGLWSPI